MKKVDMWLLLFCSCLLLFLLLFSYKAVLVFTSLSVEQQQWMNYFSGDESDAPQNYAEDELSHMRDVKKVMKGVDRIFYVLLFLIVGLGYFLWKQKELWKGVYYGSLVTCGGLLLILLWVLVDFQSIFALFHLLFFPQGNWQFAADSVLIRAFPLEFFVRISREIFGLTLLIGGGLGILGFWHSKKRYVAIK